MLRRLSPSLLLLLVSCGSDSSSGGDTKGSGLGDTPFAPYDAGVDVPEKPDLTPPLEDVPEVPDVPPVDTWTPPPEDVVEVPDTTPPPEDLLPPPDVDVPASHCTPKGGDVNIYDLRDPQCPDHLDPAPTAPPGLVVTLTGVVATGVYGDTVFVQEPEGGAYSGIAVFAHGIPTSAVKVGDELEVEGEYYEYYDLSQIYLTKWTVTGSGPAPAPYVPDYPDYLGTQGALAELFESVLVRVEGVETIHTKPDCPHDFGEFMVTGQLRIDDKGFKWDARLGDKFTAITGPLNYTFGNTKIEPRSEADLDWTKKGATSSLSKCIQGECIEPASKPGTKQLVINEILADALGNDMSQEWFELYNPGGEPVDVTGWQIKDCATQKLVLGSAVVPAGGYLVLGASSDKAVNGDAPVKLAYGDGFYLPNTIGAILLYDPAGVLVDQTRYSTFEPWTVFKVGKSLERVSPTSDGTVPESWETGKGTYGDSKNEGTPGKKN